MKKRSAPAAEQPATSTCESCDKEVPSYETTLVGEGDKHRCLCGPCYFATVSHYAGEDITHHRLEPVTISDALGTPHTFHFRYSVIPDGFGLEAFEIKRGHPGGYQFSIGGQGDPIDLLMKLYQRIKRELSRTHIEGEGRDRHLKEEVRALIDYDRESDGLPLLVIDGKDYTWKQFGKMLMCYEGWRFKLEIYDRSDEK